MPKTTKIEYEQRLFTVQGWIVDGIQPTLIIKQIVTSGWCNERQAERMLQQARARWTKVPEAQIDERRKLKIAELQQMKRSMKEQFKGTPSGIMALMAIEKHIIQLEGLAGPIKVEHSGKGGGPVQTEVKHTVTFRKYGQGN